MPGKTRWTPQQQSAIEARGENILVSAAAGSGKTAVLTERAVRRMLDPADPLDADRLMVVTFTRAAAAEMKQRMQKKLAERIAAEPDNKAARRQRRLLERAVIGTIDSLCLELVRQNRQQLGLPASFRTGDAQDTDALLHEAVDEAMESFYQSGDEQYRELVELFENRRGDGGLADAVERLLQFAKTNPFYRDWLNNTSGLYRGDKPPEQTPWGRILLEHAAQEASYWLPLVSDAKAMVNEDEALKNYRRAFEGDCGFFAELKEAAEGYDWQRCHSVVSSFAAASLAAAKSADPQKKEYLKGLREEYKKVITRLKTRLFFCDGQGFSDDAAYLAPRVEKLFGLAIEADSLLLQKKQEEGVFEFSDMQQMAAELLMERDGQSLRPSKLAVELQGRFGEIMVDEYQDVNAVQDMIINALSNGKNLFMVGDVKQSIYRFRQARPELFIARSERYAANDGGRLITLSGNFRSRRRIIDAANNIFRPLFSKQVGEIVYDERHSLESMASYPESAAEGVELCVIDSGGADSAQSLEREAAFAAKKIKELLQSGMTVSDGGETRPVRAGDIAILLRSTQSRADIYKKALEQEGIEAFAALGGGLLESFEVRSLLGFLQAVRNPTRDIELIGAMLSPIGGFSAEQLARMRCGQRRGSFFGAVQKYAGTDGKTRRFLDFFERIRRLSDTADAASVITAVIEESGFALSCRAMDNGRQRFSNLLLLIRYAEAMHEAGRRGIYAFLKAVDRIAEQNGDLAPAAAGQRQNAVTITSIHRSKGLEWPVVLLCDAGRKFGHLTMDVKTPTALHFELGFACARRDKGRRVQFTTAQLEAVRIKSAEGQLSEELRLLYVAVTRARERLIVTASAKDPAGAAERCAPEGVGLTPHETSGCQSYLHWILAALGCHGDAARALSGGTETASVDMRLIPADEESTDALQRQTEELPPDTEGQASPQREDVSPGPVCEAALEAIGRQIAFEYPYLAASRIPAKLSVSELSHNDGEAFRFTRRPAFIVKEGAGSERGTAVHAYMQFCDYQRAAADPEGELARLVAEGILTARQGELIDLAPVKTFFESGLYRRMTAADEIKREFAFMASAADCPSVSGRYSHGGESAMLQGIADCVLLESGGAVVIDYKTDRVKDAAELTKRYLGQLSLYREILGSVLHTEVKECIIWSFALGREIKVC